MDEQYEKKTDFGDRALDYAIRAVRLFRYLQKQRDQAGMIVGKQFFRAATSIGANLAEASAGQTRADFIHKCSIAQKEARECQYWLHLMSTTEIASEGRLENLKKETNEIVAILTSIVRKAKNQKIAHK